MLVEVYKIQEWMIGHFEECVASGYYCHDFAMIDESEQGLYLPIRLEPMDIESSDHYPTSNPEAAKTDSHSPVYPTFFPTLAAPSPVPCSISNQAAPECHKWSQMVPQPEDQAKQHSGQQSQRSQIGREMAKESKAINQSINETSDLKLQRKTDEEQGRKNLLKPSGSFKCSGKPRKSVRFPEVPADVVYSY